MAPSPRTALTKEQRIQAAQQHLLYERLPLSAALSMVISAGFVGLLFPFFDRQVLLVWLAVVQTVGLLRIGLWYLHKRIKPPPQDAHIWSRYFLVGVFFAATAWSYGSIQLMPEAGTNSMAILVVALLAVCSVAVSALAAHLPSLFVFMATTLGPAGIVLNLSGGAVEHVVGVALLAAVGALTWTGYQGNVAICKLLQTELELSESVMVTAQAKAAAEEANRAKTRFLATMSHEIRTPLNGVIGLTELLRGSGLSSEQQRHVELLRRSGAHLLDVVNEILDFSKIEADEVQIASQPVDVRDLIDELAGPVHARVAMTGVELEVTVADPVPAVILSDAVRLRQVIGNLLSNAVKFTEQGSIRLNVELLDGKTGDSDALLRFTVTDTGIGIPADRIGRIFEAFTQVDESTTRRAGGTGLGLAICRRLASLLGGEVGAASAPGQGSTFVFTLRVPVQSWQVLTEHVSTSGRHIRVTPLTGRALLAEDNQINREVACAMLDMLGIEHETAPEGREAVDMAASGRFDIVLMDCQMPNIDGFQATQEIRRRDVRARNGRRMPIVALTANAFADDRRRAASVGMDGFLPKPFQLDQLFGQLARWLPAAQSAADRDASTAA